MLSEREIYSYWLKTVCYERKKVTRKKIRKPETFAGSGFEPRFGVRGFIANLPFTSVYEGPCPVPCTEWVKVLVMTGRGAVRLIGWPLYD